MSDGSICANCRHYLRDHNVTKEGGNAIVTSCRLCGCAQYIDAPENPILMSAIETLKKERSELE